MGVERASTTLDPSVPGTSSCCQATVRAVVASAEPGWEPPAAGQLCPEEEEARLEFSLPTHRSQARPRPPTPRASVHQLQEGGAGDRLCGLISIWATGKSRPSV